ncbi:MAG: malate dehydrogenase, partial [Rubrobacteridae bacterium]|nr:malate dehydrogenase [Rubrobacteridae bacterium]
MAKVSIIGAGSVGATCAYTLLKNRVSDIVLVDLVDVLAKGKALDIMQSGAIEGFENKVVGTTDYAEVEGSDIVVVTAGLARQPGMSRTDLLDKNMGIVKSVVESAVSVAPDALLLIVTNPLDVMAYHALKVSGLEPHRVFGMGGALDTARYRYFVAQELDVPMSSVDGVVIGAHGDTMLPVISQTKVNGWPLSGMISDEKANEIIRKTRNGGAEIVSYLKTGSAFYAPGASAAMMVDVIINNKNQEMPSSVYVQGEYGVSDVYLSLPSRISIHGVQ